MRSRNPSYTRAGGRTAARRGTRVGLTDGAYRRDRLSGDQARYYHGADVLAPCWCGGNMTQVPAELIKACDTWTCGPVCERVREREYRPRD